MMGRRIMTARVGYGKDLRRDPNWRAQHPEIALQLELQKQQKLLCRRSSMKPKLETISEEGGPCWISAKPGIQPQYKLERRTWNVKVQKLHPGMNSSLKTFTRLSYF